MTDRLPTDYVPPTPLERELATGLRRIYLVTGNATPLVDQATAQVVAAVLARIRMPAFNHGSFRAGDASAGDAVSAARTAPMMDDLRLVVLRDVQEGSVELWTKLVEYAKSPSDTTVLVLVGQCVPKAEAKQAGWAERLAEHPGVSIHGFNAKDVSPGDFAQQHARRLGKELAWDAVRVLLEVAGTDPNILAREVEKLAGFVGDAVTIDAKAVTEATSQLAEAVIWDLTSGVARRDRNLALTALHRMLDGGAEPRQLLGMLAWQWRELLRYAELVRAGVPDDRINREVRLRPELQRAVKARVGKDFPGAAVVLGRLARAWEDMNGHKAGDRHILEALVLELIEGGGKR